MKRKRARTGCEVTDDTNMNRDVILLGGRCESERMPLEVGNFGAVEEDVLSSASRRLLLKIQEAF